jgi:hypothetical protein
MEPDPQLPHNRFISALDNLFKHLLIVELHSNRMSFGRNTEGE